MKGGTLIIGGNASIMAGLYMMGGEMIVLGDLGGYAGESMISGQIFFAGDFESLGKNASVCDVKEEEAERLFRILGIYGFDSSGLSFRKIVPKAPLDLSIRIAH